MYDGDGDPYVGTWEGWTNFAGRIVSINIYADGTFVKVDEPAPAVNDLDRGCVPSDILNAMISVQLGTWTNLSKEIGERNQTIGTTASSVCGNDGTTNQVPYNNITQQTTEIKFNKGFTEFYSIDSEGETTDEGERKVFKRIK